MRTIALALCAALVIGGGAGSARAQSLGNLRFRSIGPSISGGRLGDVAGTDRDPMLYYAGAAGGGVWKSTDGGLHWEAVFDEQDVAPIGAVAIDPSNENVVWAGTGEAAPRNDVSYGDGVYKTTDGGKHWTRMGLEGTSQIARILIDPSDGNHVVLAALGDPFKPTADRGVYETLDGGKSWKKTLYIGASTGASDLAWDPAHPQVAYAGMWQFARTNWAIESGGANDGLYRSADGGATWTQLRGNGLPPSPLGRIGLAVAPGGQRVYAIIQSARGLLWRSDDGGATWHFITGNTVVDERPFYFSRLAVDPANPDHVFALSVAIAESFDGGKTWKSTGGNLGSDHHAMWIAGDGRRIIQGGDKGVALSLDGGRRWVRVNLLPVAQVYHVGYDRAVPYHVCAALQDDGTWCAPSNSLSADGILAHDWTKVAGGDGTWVWPDPRNRTRIWYSSGGETNGGSLWTYDMRTRMETDISPYLRDQNVVPPAQLRYRFNWEAPLAFDPFDKRVAYYGGNVVFRSSDGGAHWTAISPDLTRNIKAHQRITGGITNEGTGAETSDTILAIAPSPISRGLLWVGTDDGNIALTRDGGAHWTRVSVPKLDAHARIESISPSHASAAIAYASVERHYAGDRHPYVYKTADYGRHWRSISANLPADQFVRTVLEDPRNAEVLYAGLEQSFWASFNGGGSWQRIVAGLPAASVRDIAVQPDTNDLILGTHGRGVYILDDATPLQRLASLHGPALLPVRTAHLLNYHETTFNLLAPGENPPDGAIVTIYQPAPGAAPPAVTIVDAHGRTVRTLAFTNEAGLQRVAWPLCDAPPTPWRSAPSWNQGERCGAPVVPGTYRVVAHVGGRTFSQPLVVAGTPGTAYSQADYRARRDLEMRMYAVYDGIDRDLNALDAMRVRAPAAMRARIDALSRRLSANMQNDQDDDFVEDMLRERVQGFLSTLDGAYSRPTAAQYREAGAIEGEYARLSAQFGKVRDAIARL
jgi:photosystem II stability/assembly factor-like uncharacterized protein